MNSNKLGFLSLYQTNIADSFVGTLLITDNFGIPLEFKCTHAVKASPIQKALYGERLKPYIGIELCGVPLINSVTNYPDLIFINIDFFIAIRSQLSSPVILVNKAVDELINKPTDEISETENKIFIEHEFENFEPIIIQSHPDFKKDVSDFSEQIKAMFNNFDLCEPFDRMKKSVEILGKNDNKFN